MDRKAVLTVFAPFAAVENSCAGDAGIAPLYEICPLVHEIRFQPQNKISLYLAFFIPPLSVDPPITRTIQPKQAGIIPEFMKASPSLIRDVREHCSPP